MLDTAAQTAYLSGNDQDCITLTFTNSAKGGLLIKKVDAVKTGQGTIAAAAVINEVIAVYMAKKGFEWAGELQEGGRSGKGRKRKAGGAV